MKSGGIEDILIGGGYNNTKKKKGKGVKVFFFLLFLIIIVLAAAYWYYTNQTVSYKELFAQNISKNNINKLLQNDIYTALYNRVLTESTEIESSIKLTTEVENEEIKDVDFTKFILDISNSNDVQNSKSYGEAVLNYSGNEIFNLKLLSNENGIALASNEIYDKYLGVHYDKIQEVFGIEVDINELKQIENVENIDFSEEEKNEYLKKYYSFIFENIPEEKFSSQENIAIKKDKTDKQASDENIEVTNYSLTLNQEELKSLIVKVLENVKSDEELIEKIILTSNIKNDEENNVTEISTNEINANNTIQITPEVDIAPEEDVTAPAGETPNTIEGTPPVEVTDNQLDETQLQTEQNGQATSDSDGQATGSQSTNTTLEPSIPVVTINPVGTVNITAVDNGTEESEIETTDINELINQESQMDAEKILTRISLGKRVDATVEDVQNAIDELIEEVNKLEGNGLKINVYASEEKVEKINATLPNDNTLELEFTNASESSEHKDSIKITYLYQNDKNMTDSIEENTISEDEASKVENSETKENKADGFSLKISKSKSNASTTLVAEYSFIENETINKKIKVNLKTDGTATSKEIKNDIVVTVSTSESEIQAAIDNIIKFTNELEIPDLNNENCVFVDTLTPEERTTTINDIKNKITNLYTNQKDNLSFIDTNTYSPTTLENASSTITREEAKNALITRVGNMMQEAIDKNEEFTIQNLVDLKIDGYEVSSRVTEQSATIVVDVYTFNIDTSFTLTDVE